MANSKKRALSELDSNINPSVPPAKRQSTGDGLAGKENIPEISYKSLTKTRLCELLRDRSLPVSGTKDKLVQRLQEHDKGTMAPPSKSQQLQAEDATQAETTFEFTTMCRPRHDVVAQKRAEDDEWESDMEDDEDDEDGEDEAEPAPQNKTDGRKTGCGLKNCVCKDSPSQHPGWKWLLSKKAYQTIANFQFELAIRDQDMAGTHVCNDWNGYGFSEVMENHLLSFNQEIQKKSPSLPLLWSSIETFAWILVGDVFEWFNIDDPDRVLAILKLVGGATFCTLDLLDKQSLVKPDSPVMNLALILGLLFQGTAEWPGDTGVPELSWREAVARHAQLKGIEIKEAPFGIEKSVQEALDEGAFEDSDTNWEKFKWTKEFASYTKDNKPVGKKTIGGRHYVLQKGSARRA